MGRFDRAVGVVIGATALGGALLLWFAVASGGLTPAKQPTEGFVVGVWTVFYNIQAPPPQAILVAIAVGLLLTAGLALLERRVSNRSRRSTNGQLYPLAAKLVMEQTRGVFAGPVTLTVLIPAYNEEDLLAGTLTSLLAQSRRPDRVIVVADNCTDSTVAIARQRGVEVIQSQGNTKKKAGALNQALTAILPRQGDNDLVMVMDADTTLDDGFLAAAVTRFTDDRALMAVGGLFYGEEGFGLLGQFQRNEYIRYAREMKRRRGRVFVLTGTASIFRPAALRAVAANRGATIPGTPGDVYDTAALTEDNEITIALKSLGALIISPTDCTVVTEVMPTVRTLWRQRLRWQRGALENIGAYGMTPPTLRYWAQQLGLGYGVIALGAFMLLTLLMFVSVDTWVWFLFWLGLGSVFVAERVFTVWKGGWRARALAITIVPELVYDLFLNTVHVKGTIDITFGRKAAWGHAPEKKKKAMTSGGVMHD
jgi:cellulose synthase/poly-beta-1,6-N-acetylglucosamine synthase-like glycosyltransferase